MATFMPGGDASATANSFVTPGITPLVRKRRRTSEKFDCVYSGSKPAGPPKNLEYWGIIVSLSFRANKKGALQAPKKERQALTCLSCLSYIIFSQYLAVIYPIFSPLFSRYLPNI
jgi:hypothetical protein